MKYIIIILLAIVIRGGDPDSLKNDSAKTINLAQQMEMNSDVDSIQFHLKSIIFKLDSIKKSETDSLK